MRELLFYVTVAYLLVAVVVIFAFYLTGSSHAFSNHSLLAEAAATAFGWPWYIWKFLGAST